MSDTVEKNRSSFGGDVLRLMSGSSVAQIITILAAPVLARLYAPEAYGLVALYGSIVGIAGVLACFRYEMTIVLPDNDRESANMLMLSIISAVVMGILVGVFMWFFGHALTSILDTPGLVPFLWLIPVAVTLGGVGSALNYWNTRTKHFGRLSVNRVISQTVVTSGNLGAGLLGKATGGAMIISGFVGQFVATGLLGYQVLLEHGKFLRSNVSIVEMRAGLLRYRRFPLISSWGALINTASWQLPVLLLGVFFTPVIVGLYALGYRIIQIPLGIIGGALSQVFFQHGSETKQGNGLRKIVADVFGKIVIFGLVPAILLAMVGADLFAVVFGEKWRQAGLYSQLLAPWAFLWFMSSPLSTIYIILEKQREELHMHAFIFLARMVGIIIGGLYFDAVLAIALFSLGGVISYGYLLKAIFGLSGNTTKNLLRVYSSYITKSILVTVPVLLLAVIGTESILLLLAAASSAFLYYVLIKDDVYELYHLSQ